MSVLLRKNFPVPKVIISRRAGVWLADEGEMPGLSRTETGESNSSIPLSPGKYQFEVDDPDLYDMLED